MVSVAFFVLQDEVVGSGRRVPWTSHGGGGGSSSFFGGGGEAKEAVKAEGDTAKRLWLLGPVKAAWLSRGYQPGTALQASHTQGIWKSREAAAKARG